VNRYQKGKTNLDFTEARDSEWQWHQITMPAPHHSSFFTRRMPFLPPDQQCQSTEGKSKGKHRKNISRFLSQEASDELLCELGEGVHSILKVLHDRP